MEQALAAERRKKQGNTGLKPGAMSAEAAGAAAEEVRGSFEMHCPLKKYIPWNSDPRKVEWSDILFQHFFSSLEGKAKIANEILHDQRIGYFATAQAQGIRFHCPDAEDPDYLVTDVLVVLAAMPCYSLCRCQTDQKMFSMRDQVGK